VGVLGFACFTVPGQAQELKSEPVLVTYGNSFGNPNAISDRQLSEMINAAVPSQDTKRLLIFVQCYGGAFAKSEHFNKPNTATMAGTHPDQPATYGGYHQAAAKALRPGKDPGTGQNFTGQTVHDAGVAERFEDASGDTDATEQPTVGGGMALSDFSLESVVLSGTGVQSRHIVVFTGRPGIGAAINKDGDKIWGSDSVDQINIRKNFFLEGGAIVHTVGYDGTGVFDYPGTAKGLKAALDEVREELTRPGVDPSKEQFIFFAGDHGVYRKTLQTSATIPSGARSAVSVEFAALSPANEDAIVWGSTRTSVSFFVPFDEFYWPIPRDQEGNYLPSHGQGDFIVDISWVGGAARKDTLVLTDFFELFRDEGSDVLGDSPGEGLEFRFEVDKADFLGFAGSMLEIGITNANPFPVTVGAVTLSAGAIPKGPHRPFFADGFESGDASNWS
jgi:hypothetical protein